MEISRVIDELKNTGERPILNTRFEDIEPVLQFAYGFVSKKISENNTILDYGCGGGYGTEYLSRFTKNKTCGFDIDKKVISTNNIFFKAAKNLKFIARKNEIGTEKYDVVVSLQVIEHLSNLVEVDKYINSLKEYLKDDGLLVIGTVNKNITSLNLKKPVMPYHIHEFYPQELTLLLKIFFSRVDCFGQIDEASLDQLRMGKWSYEENLLGFRNKFLRAVSQVELARKIIRCIPVFIKNLLLGYDKKNIFQQNYVLTQDKKEVDNSYILIYECRK